MPEIKLIHHHLTPPLQISMGLSIANILDKKAHRLLSVSDSSASKTAAPINKYVNVHTTSDKVRTFCRFIVPINESPEVTFEEALNYTHKSNQRNCTLSIQSLEFLFLLLILVFLFIQFDVHSLDSVHCLIYLTNRYTFHNTTSK